VIIERKDLLDPFRPAARLIVQHFERLADFLDARVVGRHLAGLLAAIDAVEDRRNIEQLAAGLEEVLLQGFVRRQRFHHLAPFFLANGFCEYSRLVTWSKEHRATRSVSG